MERKNIIRALSNHIMLDSLGIEEPGLCYGSSGISICLFESSRILKDSYIEDFAFALLKQSLVSDYPSVSFHNGLSGIGYALAYLVRHKFIKTNIESIFQAQEQHIIDNLISIIPSQANFEKLIDTLYLAFYFLNVHHIPACTKKLREINKECDKRFTRLWHIISEGYIDNDTEEIIQLWETYQHVLKHTNRKSNCSSTALYQSLITNGYIRKSQYVIRPSSSIHKSTSMNAAAHILQSQNTNELEQALNKLFGLSRHKTCLKNGIAGLLLRTICEQRPNDNHIRRLLKII